MKKIQYVAVAVMVMSLLASVPAFSAEVSDVVADHKALATSYQQKVADQDALIQEHREMKQDYENRFYINEKLTPKSGLHGNMDRHCDAIISAAEQEKQALLDLAKWHEMRAAELEGM